MTTASICFAVAARKAVQGQPSMLFSNARRTYVGAALNEMRSRTVLITGNRVGIEFAPTRWRGAVPMPAPIPKCPLCGACSGTLPRRLTAGWGLQTILQRILTFLRATTRPEFLLGHDRLRLRFTRVPAQF